MTQSPQPIVVEQVYDVPIEVVWNAITTHEQMVDWFFDNIPEFRAEVGFETQFSVESDGREFLHLWRIVDVIPGQKIVFDWRYRGFSGVGKVTFEVLEEGAGARLRVTNEGVESFTDDIPEFSRESCEEGWKYLIQESLNSYLESN